MNPSDSRSANLLLEALEILHAHHYSTFEQRLFEATRKLFRETGQTIEVFELTDGRHTLETDMEFRVTTSRSEFFERLGELVKKDHPAFPLLKKGVLMPFRLTDFLSHRDFRNTDLYNEGFKIVEVKYQIAMPFATPTCMGGLTINRKSRDFSDEELALAGAFTRHVGIAYQSHQIIQQALAPAAREKKAKVDYSRWLQIGLTKRECETLYWITQGKRDSEIAVLLGISLRTVHVHVRSLLFKLKVENRTAAATMAAKLLEI